MAEKGFWARFLGINEASSQTERENQVGDVAETNISESTGKTLQDVVSFVAELQSYYYSDICKMQSDLLIQTALTEGKVNFINKKIKQEQVALSQIDEILDLVRKQESEYQSIWRKSVYSFYEEIEKAQLLKVQAKVFKIILRLCIVNTKPELKNVILNRIEKYKAEWGITEEVKIPLNYNVVLVEEDNGVEKYQFGEFSKYVITTKNDRFLTSEQLEKIRTMDFEVDNEILTDIVWIHISSVTRRQLNFMRKTSFFDNDWEYAPKENDLLCLDIVCVSDLEQYIKGMLQIILTKRNHAVISIVVPSSDMLRVIGPTVKRGDKVEICKKYQFYIKERSGLYKDNLLTARIDRRNIPEKLQFISYLQFRKIYF